MSLTPIRFYAEGIKNQNKISVQKTVFAKFIPATKPISPAGALLG
jgi:hypothetical protein